MTEHNGLVVAADDDKFAVDEIRAKRAEPVESVGTKVQIVYYFKNILVFFFVTAGLQLCPAHTVMRACPAIFVVSFHSFVVFIGFWNKTANEGKGVRLWSLKGPPLEPAHVGFITEAKRRVIGL